MKPRSIVFGDVHGDSRSLNLLLDQINPQTEDHLIFLGDVIDRGLDSNGVIRTLIDLSSRTRLTLITGNHEEMCLEGHNQEPPNLSKWLAMGGQSAIDSYETERMPQNHLDFLAKGVDYFENESFIFLHANWSNGCQLKDTPARILRWEFLPNDRERIPRHFSGKTVICGHTTVGDNALDLGRLIGLDTGAGEGRGWLTALDVDAGVFHAANEYGEYRTYRREFR